MFKQAAKSAAIGVAYTSLNFRYASLILPVGVVAYLMGLPASLVVAAGVLLALAFVAELTTSIMNGVSAAQAIAYQEKYLTGGFDELADYANGGWLNGGVEGQEPGEGEAGGEEGQPAK